MNEVYYKVKGVYFHGEQVSQSSVIVQSCNVHPLLLRHWLSNPAMSTLAISSFTVRSYNVHRPLHFVSSVIIQPFNFSRPRKITKIRLQKQQQQQQQQHKKAVLSQRWPRDAPYIWVPWILGTPWLRPRQLFPTFFMVFCSDRTYECSYKIGIP